jgi:competence protein ComEC
MACAGAASDALSRPAVIGWTDLPPREMTLVVRLERVFPQADVRNLSAIGEIIETAAPVRGMRGQRVYVGARVARGTATPVRGAVVEVVGVVGPLPRDPPAASFEGFLDGAGVTFRCARGRVMRERVTASGYRTFCAGALARLSQILGEDVAKKRPELIGVFRAMLLGQQHELTKSQTTLFRQTGTMHVFSISGLHIGVMAVGLLAVLSVLRIPRWFALGLCLGALWLYVDVTGLAPSAIRAFLMVAFVQIAGEFRLPRFPLAALAASALVVVVANPLDFFSASFQMSYGIVAALLLLGLPLAERWHARLAVFRDLPKASWSWHHTLRDAMWRWMLSAGALGISSALVGAVTGAEFFGMVAPGALLANLWVIPVSGVVILMGLVSLLVGLLGFAAAASLANHAAAVVLWLVDILLRWNLRLPGMWFGASFRFPALGPSVLAALIAAMLHGYARRWEGECRGFWPPFAVVGLALLLGIRLG